MNSTKKSQYLSVKPLSWRQSDESQILKMNLDGVDAVKVAMILKREAPGMNLKDSLYVAHLVKKVYAAGVTRGKVVNNA